MDDNKLDENQIDDLFAGPPSRSGESFAEIARHLAGARSQLVQAPPPQVQKEHLAALIAAAGASAHREPALKTTGAPAGLRTRARAAALRLGAGVTALSLSTAGLAYAGVDLPGQAAERAFEVVGIELPHQASDEPWGLSLSEAVRAVIEGSDATGCEFGQAVAEVASHGRSNAPEQARDGCSSPSDVAAAVEKGRSDEPPRGSKETGVEMSSQGKARADENKAAAVERSNGRATPGEGPAGGPSEGDHTGEDASGQGRARADEARAANPVPEIVDSVKEQVGGKPEDSGKPAETGKR